MASPLKISEATWDCFFFRIEKIEQIIRNSDIFLIGNSEGLQTPAHPSGTQVSHRSESPSDSPEKFHAKALKWKGTKTQSWKKNTKCPRNESKWINPAENLTFIPKKSHVSSCFSCNWPLEGKAFSISPERVTSKCLGLGIFEHAKRAALWWSEAEAPGSPQHTVSKKSGKVAARKRSKRTTVFVKAKCSEGREEAKRALEKNTFHGIFC